LEKGEMVKAMQPIFMMKDDDFERTEGKNAKKLNIQVAKEVANVVRTTLGPRGQDKLIVDVVGDITVSNDGVTILEEMKITDQQRLVWEQDRAHDASLERPDDQSGLITGTPILPSSEVAVEENNAMMNEIIGEFAGF